MITSRLNSARTTDSARSPAPRKARRVETAQERCRRHFLRFFPAGFRDHRYVSWERFSKWETHKQWQESLNGDAMRSLLRRGKHAELAERALQIEAQTSLLFSFEKMALRDAIKPAAGARAFAAGLYELLHGTGELEERFDSWCAVVGELPRRQTRVLTWPVVTVFGFLAQPEAHLILKPMATLGAAEAYEYELPYEARPSYAGYVELLRFARRLRADLRDLGPRDMIDLQSFIWVQGSTEYA